MKEDEKIYTDNAVNYMVSFCWTCVLALFRACCTPLYTAPLWVNYKKSSMQKLHVAYNDAMRILLKIPRGGSASQMVVTAGVRTFKALLRNIMFHFMLGLEESGNCIMVALSKPTVSCSRYVSRLRMHCLNCICSLIYWSIFFLLYCAWRFLYVYFTDPSLIIKREFNSINLEWGFPKV